AGISDGQLITSISGGIAPYLITYSGAVSGSTSLMNPGEIIIDGLPEGSYSIIVTDLNGCSGECNTIIDAVICDIVLDAQTQDISCFSGSDGMISLSLSGQTGTIIYSWSGATNPGNV